MRLHPVQGRCTKCAPAAISVLTGLSTDEARQVLHHVAPERPANTGTTVPTMQTALKQLGVTLKLRQDYRAHTTAPTVATCAAALSDTGTYLCATPDHFLVLQVESTRVLAVDNQSGGPVALANFHARSASCERVWLAQPATLMFDWVKFSERRLIEQAAADDRFFRDAEAHAYAIALAETAPTPPPLAPPPPAVVPPVRVLKKFMVTRDAAGRMTGALEVEVV